MLGDNDKITTRYHHGNVKQALIDEALKLIASDDIGSITVRRLSREVGVTPSAVYNHFADKDELLLAIKLRLYEHLNRFIDARITTPDNPEKALLELSCAYFYYAKEHPSEFHFLFSFSLPTEWSTPEAVDVFCASLSRARKLVLEIYKKYQVPCDETAVDSSTLLVWSQLHGIVALRNSGSIPAAVTYLNWPEQCALTTEADVEKLIKMLINNLVNGILNAQHSESHH